MKILSLCCLLFVCLVSVSEAQESSKPRTDHATVQDSWSGDTYYFFRSRPDNPYGASTENYCAYIRAYRVRRETPNSDAVAPAGYTTCVPSRRFEIKSAVEVQTEPASHE
jgi:hypothetical protein